MLQWIKNRWHDFTRAFTGWVGVTLAALIGIIVGVGIFTMYYAGFTSYFGNDPATCNQCHAMNEQYNSWLKGSHKGVATCNDCHSPHDNIVYKYVNKADNGFWHALKFTTRDYPENIKIREVNRQITEEACLYCHGSLVSEIEGTRTHDNAINCLQCHSNVGHLR